MEGFFVDYLNRLESLHNDLKACLGGLEQAGLDWTPGAGMNSLCVLAIHVAGSERYWIGDVVAGEPSARDREAEFHTQGLSSEALIQRLDASLAYATSALGRFVLEDLEKNRTSPRDGRFYSVGWALGHVLAHTGIHAGHAQMGRQIWEMRPSN